MYFVTTGSNKQNHLFNNYETIRFSYTSTDSPMAANVLSILYFVTLTINPVLTFADDFLYYYSPPLRVYFHIHYGALLFFKLQPRSCFQCITYWPTACSINMLPRSMNQPEFEIGRVVQWTPISEILY